MEHSSHNDIGFLLMPDSPCPPDHHVDLTTNASVGLEHCWQLPGWENGSSSAESSVDNAVDRSFHGVGHLSARPWPDWWSHNSSDDPFLQHSINDGVRGQLDLMSDWEIIHDDNSMLAGDKLELAAPSTNKSNVSASSCSETGSLSLASSSLSDIAIVPHAPDQLRLGMISSPKTQFVYSEDQNLEAPSNQGLPWAVCKMEIISEKEKMIENVPDRNLSAGEIRECIRETAGKRGMEEEIHEGIASARNQCSVDGLKLGKRTYFEDAKVGTLAKGSKEAASDGLRKKAKPNAVQHPRCQAEGCKEDLSTARDYHRRHRVCALHSKASKVKVNDSDQRFCQQCSRFHAITEFDEDKRSCRRRLAGHNERRRKPQPRMLPSFAGAICSFVRDGMCPSSISFNMGGPYFMQHGHASVLGSAQGLPQSTYNVSGVSKPYILPNLCGTCQGLMFLQGAHNCSSQMPHQAMQVSGCVLGDNPPILKPSPTAKANLFGTLPAAYQSQMDVSDSWRALSLLSSWGCPNYFDPTTSDICSSSCLSSHSPPLSERLFFESPVLSSQHNIGSSSFSPEGHVNYCQEPRKGVTSVPSSQDLMSFWQHSE